MKRATKILIVVLCASFCGVGTILSLKERGQENRAKTKVHPINNRAQKRGAWIWS